MYRMHMWGGGFGPGGGIFPLISMLIFWAVIIVGAVLIIRMLNRNARFTPAPAGQPKALDILQERYARGEIDTADYEERRRTLTVTGSVEHPPKAQ